MGAAACRGKGFKERARVSGKRPMGAASFRQQCVQASCPHSHEQAPPPLPTPLRFGWYSVPAARVFLGLGLLVLMGCRDLRAHVRARCGRRPSAGVPCRSTSHGLTGCVEGFQRGFERESDSLPELTGAAQLLGLSGAAGVSSRW